MRRALSIIAVLASLGVALLATAASDGKDTGVDYWVELDNAFGLVDGADVKIAGVRAGKIVEMDIDRREMRALIGIDITRPGFEDLRADVFCETRPQSLIGEYFVDCHPGKQQAKLPRGSRVPVKQTGSTVPVDLVNSIMRRPYRERFSILLSELGAALAARGDDLDVTIRRAVPALRETDRVLAMLARQRRTIRDLNDDADTVLKSLADARGEVVRFVKEAGDTSEIQASRATQLRAQFQRLPGFLRELRPTMRSLGNAAADQGPALRTLAAQSKPLQTFLGALGDFATASRPTTRTLAQAARRGRPAVQAARPQVRRLARAVKPLPELARNAAITFEALDDPKRAVEKDTRSGRADGGFTGLEAVLRYIWAQGQATNIFDSEGHILKIMAFLDPTCGFYTDAEHAKTQPARCAAILGPGRPGIDEPDPTKTTAAKPAKRRRAADKPAAAPAAPAATPAPSLPSVSATPAPVKRDPTAPVGELLEDVLDALPPIIGGGEQRTGLLDYLLGNGGPR